MAHPAHDEIITVMPSLPAPQTYTLKGYAYAGGGRRVARVEVTLDAGTTWILADIAYPEDAYKEVTWKGDVWGKMDAETDQSFCWAFWELEVEVERLKGGSIAVRAIDESLSGQGEGMYWK
jgi:nitrate reductase (NAD(P)H)